MDVGGFGDVVEFAVDEFTKIVDDGDEIDVAIEPSHDGIRDPAPPSQDVQVEGDDVLAPRTLDLEGHRLVGRQQVRLVDLAN